ncbi:hypothetical protein [Streptomyces sp. NPDC048196]|uniref:hypothetical protein n=1 Tax=Streptomyces sp. NPDC048196 TaxID=3154712 RepID=UPI0033E01CCC
MTRNCTCRHCLTPAPVVEPEPVAPVALPTEPRQFRVHNEDGDIQNCTLHPDGTMTMVMAGQVWRSLLSFDEMRQMNWANARIEWDPAPLVPEAEAPPTAGPVQDAIPLQEGGP